MAYHKRQIKKGVIGEVSKIREELEELEDALEQGNKILSICELSDMYGAIKAVLEKHYPGFTMKDIEKMAEATKESFLDGTRY